MKHHDQRASWGGKGLFGLHFSIAVQHWSQFGQELKQGRVTECSGSFPLFALWGPASQLPNKRTETYSYLRMPSLILARFQTAFLKLPHLPIASGFLSFSTPYNLTSYSTACCVAVWLAPGALSLILPLLSCILSARHPTCPISSLAIGHPALY